MAQTPLPGGPNIIKTPITGGAGAMDPVWQRWFTNVIQRIQNGLDIIGRFTGQLAADATIEGHAGTVGTTFQHLTASGQFVASQLTGTVAPTALPLASGAIQGAVIAPGSTLGSASLADTSAFDPAGAAATAQASAESYANAQDTITLNAAKAYTDGKFLPGLSVTITTAALTGTGTQGSMTFTNGLLTAQTPAT